MTYGIISLLIIAICVLAGLLSPLSRSHKPTQILSVFFLQTSDMHLTHLSRHSLPADGDLPPQPLTVLWIAE